VEGRGGLAGWKREWKWELVGLRGYERALAVRWSVTLEANRLEKA